MKKNNLLGYVLLFLGVLVFVFIAMLFYSHSYNATLFRKDIFFRIKTLPGITSFIVQTIVLTSLLHTIYYIFQRQKKQNYTILNNIAQPIIICNLSGSIKYANKFAQSFFGYIKDEIYSQNIFNFIAEYDKQRAYLNVKEVKDNKIATVNSYNVLTADGDWVECTVHTSFHYGKLLSTFINQSDTKTIEKKQKEQTEFLWSLLNDIPVPLSYLDNNNIFKFVNKSYCKLMEQNEQNFLGNNLFDVFKDIAINEANLEYIKESQESSEYEEIRLIGNRKKILKLVVTPKIENNITVGTFTAIIDKTKERKLEILNKKEIRLNIIFAKILTILVSSPINIRDTSIDKSLDLVRKALNIDKCYVIQLDDSAVVAYEASGVGLKECKGYMVHLSNQQQNFTEVKQLIIPNLSVSQFKNLKYYKTNEARSVAEILIPKDNMFGSDIIIGAMTSFKHKNWQKNEINFIQSVGKIISTSIERKQYIQELKYSEDTLNILVDNSNIGFFIHTLEDEIVFINNKTKELFGYKLEEIESILFIQDNIVLPEYHETIKNMMKLAELKGQASGFIKIKNKNGKIFSVEIHIKSIDYETSKAYLYTMIDVSKYIGD